VSALTAVRELAIPPPIATLRGTEILARAFGPRDDIDCQQCTARCHGRENELTLLSDSCWLSDAKRCPPGNTSAVEVEVR